MPKPSMQLQTPTRFIGLFCQTAVGESGCSRCLPSRADTMLRLSLQSSKLGPSTWCVSCLVSNRRAALFLAMFGCVLLVVVVVLFLLPTTPKLQADQMTHTVAMLRLPRILMVAKGSMDPIFMLLIMKVTIHAGMIVPLVMMLVVS